ncbi:MAG: Lrp/AsnC ligand binding domain-containing protein [Nitrosotalea sp.]
MYQLSIEYCNLGQTNYGMTVKTIGNFYIHKKDNKAMQKLSQINHTHKIATAHLIIKCRSGEENRIIEQLKNIDAVKSVQRTIGEFDILVKVESDDSDSLRRIIKWKIMKNDKIQSITTLMCTRRSLCVIVEE